MDEKTEKRSSMDGSIEKIDIEHASIPENKNFIATPAEKKLVKKINRAFAPLLCLILFIQFCDKTTLSMAAILPQFYKDTHISQDQYSWVSSIFYLGYLSMQLFNNYMLQKYPIAKFVGIVLVIWGATLLSMAWATSFSQLAALRFLLGFFEAVTYPAMFLLIATLYRRSEQVIWFGVMFMSNGLAGILGSVIGVGVLQMPTVGNISPWKWSQIIFGSFTCLLGFFYFVFLPDTPTSRWFRLTDEEKKIVEERTRDNAVVPTASINYNQIREALREPRFYCYMLISLFGNFQNGALTNFSTIIIKNLGFTGVNTILLNIPSGAMSLLLIALFTFISKKKNEIIYVAVAATTVSLVGLVILTAIPNGGGRLAGLYLAWSNTSAYLLMQASITSNVSGYTKKIFYTSVNLIFYTFGNFIGPLLLVEKDSPRYLTGMGVYVACNIMNILLFLFIRYSYVKQNKKRQADNELAEIALPGELEDLTDVENKHFVYRP
ncbi:dal9 allantoate permease [Mucor ambiguus]|uniref:Dal9 allantoate permease n=1 Tax=Mucor ambiguus TaxID=91626 RepID=A0A0C9N3M6_9FUNG|nr:dal9 allantoate permease [Mucor ambiguus]